MLFWQSYDFVVQNLCNLFLSIVFCCIVCPCINTNLNTYFVGLSWCNVRLWRKVQKKKAWEKNQYWKGLCVQMEIPSDAQLVVLLGLNPSHSTWLNIDLFICNARLNPCRLNVCIYLFIQLIKHRHCPLNQQGLTQFSAHIMLMCI